jgi:response regulator RpfG family c-di-GMP phosphodiesterase
VFDVELIKLFLTNYSVALDNYILNNMIYETQREIIITLGEVVEKHFDETSNHVNRMSEMMYRFAKLVGYPHMEAEMIKVGSTLHDVGKIGIPDSILKKPGKLTPEEFKVIMKHTVIGHKILSRSDLEIIKLASDIALNHHEKYDGSGYPDGLSGENIPKLARMLAILDVFDAMTHQRVYKDAAPELDALRYIEDQSGRHFDPELVAVFIENLEHITKG